MPPMSAEALPAAPTLADVRARVASIREQAGIHADPARAARLRDVVIVGSSSRGGSSIFAELLRRSPALLHLRAEVNPFLVLAGLAGHGPSDALTATDAHDERARALLAELSLEVGTPADALDGEADVARFAAELACRLVLQWPTERITLGPVRRALDDAMAEAPVDSPAFFALFLRGVRRAWPAVDPRAYDLDRALITRLFPHLGPYAGPGPLVVEEPPYVCIRPWRLATDHELATRPLVVKTPSNAYRLPFWRALLPDARVRLLHLTRNVAASVNGLYDGWRFPGFYSHPVGGLQIHGYSDVFPEWGRRWWKFDLPPGWEELRARPLEEVCAFQWRSAHTALLAGGPAHRLRFEDLVGEPLARATAFAGLEEWLGVGLRDVHLAELPPVMATARPRARRWFARAGLLGPVLDDPRNLSLMERLGYAPDPDTWH